MCRETGKIFLTQSALERYEASQIKKRRISNFEILTNNLYNNTQHIHDNHWNEGLLFLQHHNFDPATFRQSLITKLKYRLETNVLNTFNSVLESCVEAHKCAEDSSLQFTSDYDPAPIWKLPFIFERLVLGPNPDRLNKTSSINTIVSQRLHLFQSGQLSLLYKESNAITSKTRKQFSEDPVKIQQSAQLAADLDNRKSAYARICQHMPVANITDSNIDVLHGLHPPSLNLIMDEPRTRRHSTRLQQQSRRKFSLGPDDMIPILTSL